MRKFNLPLLLMAVLVMFTACKKNSNEIITEITYNDAGTVTANVSGIVVDENNLPVAGATVTLGSQMVTTNVKGVFRFQQINISKNNGFVTVSRPGYFKGFRSFVTMAGRTNTLRIKLSPKNISGTFNGSAGGAVSLSSGAKVVLPANALVDAGGNAYTGTVNVAMVWLNPKAADLASTIPGDLRGINTDGYERVLETYGMLGVELTNTSGQTLKIAAGKTAEITMPVPAAMQASAPSVIPLWHFDEVKGRWIQEGSANRVGNNYVGTVTHFSFWNLDLPYNSVNLCVTVQNQNLIPLGAIVVAIHRTNVPGCTGYGMTDSLGNVCGRVPKNEPLSLELLDECGSVIYTQNIGPFAADASVNIAANIVGITITGKILNCSNAAVTNGCAYISTGFGYLYSSPVNSSGVFTLVIPNCGNVNYSVLPVDNATSQQGSIVMGTASVGTVNLGNLVACGSNSAQFLHMWIDGVPFLWNEPADTLVGINFLLPPGSSPAYFCSLRSYRPYNTNPGGGVDGINVTFENDNATGIVNLNSISIYITSAALFSNQVITPTPKITITNWGPPLTGFMEGNFSFQMQFIVNNLPVIKQVQCDFRFRRP